MKFKASFCDPIVPKEIELGDFTKDEIIDQFEKIEWKDYLEKIRTTKQDDIYFNPCFEVENMENKTNLIIGAVGKPDGEPNSFEFYFVFKRPKIKKSFFGLIKNEKNHSTKIENQSKNDALECLKAFLGNEAEYLTTKFGE